MIRKLLICPYFGDLPEWMPHWFRNTERLSDHGYAILIDRDEDGFRERVKRVLEIDCPPMADTGRIWNFRPAFGLLYAAELAHLEADWWGHTDFDVVYGRVEQWMTDELLDSHDLISNHPDYVCGPWTLYRNTPTVNQLFRMTGEWRQRMAGDDFRHGWIEKGYTELVDAAHETGVIRRLYTNFQTSDWDDFSTLTLRADGALMEGDTEVMLAHFRRQKQWPAGCVLSRVAA